MCQSIDGLPVRNARTELVVEVRRGDATKATPQDPDNCAAAWAVWRQEGLEAKVYRNRTYLRYADHWERLRTPRSLWFEQGVFDRGGTFEPGVHVLKVLSERAKPTGKRQGSNKTTKTGRNRPAPDSYKNVRAHA